MLCTQKQNPHAVWDKRFAEGNLLLSSLLNSLEAKPKQQLLQLNRKQATRQVRLEMNLSQQITNVSLRNRLTEPYFLIIATSYALTLLYFILLLFILKSQTIPSVCQVVFKTSFWKRLQKCQDNSLWLFSQTVLCFYDQTVKQGCG